MTIYEYMNQPAETEPKRTEPVDPMPKLTVLDGREVKGYPKIATDEDAQPSFLQLQPGSIVCKLKKQPKEMSPEEGVEARRADVDLFIRNAFFLYDHAEEILSDSRMLLAPVEIQNGLAYTGTSGFQCPTLGGYLTWWLKSDGLLTHDEKGEEALTYYFAGSPLSGSNRCSCVYRDGHEGKISFAPFIPVWRSFGCITTHFRAPKAAYEAYTLAQVIELLKLGDISKERMLERKLELAEDRLAEVKETLKTTVGMLDESLEKIDQMMIDRYRPEIEEYDKISSEKMNAAKAEYDQLRTQKTALKAQFKAHKVEDKEYQKLMRTIQVKIHRLKRTLPEELKVLRDELIQKTGLTVELLEKFDKLEKPDFWVEM